MQIKRNLKKNFVIFVIYLFLMTIGLLGNSGNSGNWEGVMRIKTYNSKNFLF